jgi:hypothetical protein
MAAMSGVTSSAKSAAMLAGTARERTGRTLGYPLGRLLLSRGGGSVMFNCCDKLREANRHVVESRERVEAEEARAAALARNGEPIEAVTVRLEEAKFTLRVMERHRDLLLWDHARGS